MDIRGQYSEKDKTCFYSVLIEEETTALYFSEKVVVPNKVAERISSGINKEDIQRSLEVLDKYEVNLRMLSRFFKVTLLLFMVVLIIVVLYDVLEAPKVLTRENNKGNEFE